ncbi:MAG: hypothetical protein HKN42_04905 [Granulosicoccus sp.]|nr:hypothetical protein [Granulosicoccus sp.]
MKSDTSIVEQQGELSGLLKEVSKKRFKCLSVGLKSGYLCGLTAQF